MVAQSDLDDAQTDRAFHALAVGVRRDILQRTLVNEESVSALARHYNMSFAAVQKHVSVLEEAEMIVKRASGRERLVRANPATLARITELLTRYEVLWRSRVARLDDLMAEEPPATPEKN